MKIRMGALSSTLFWMTVPAWPICDVKIYRCFREEFCTRSHSDHHWCISSRRKVSHPTNIHFFKTKEQYMIKLPRSLEVQGSASCDRLVHSSGITQHIARQNPWITIYIFGLTYEHKPVISFDHTLRIRPVDHRA